jgi:hypothetical protein
MMRFRYVRYSTLPEARDYWRNKAERENGCDAWVSLCAHPTLPTLMVPEGSLPYSQEPTKIHQSGDGNICLFCVMSTLPVESVLTDGDTELNSASKTGPRHCMLTRLCLLIV